VKTLLAFAAHGELIGVMREDGSDAESVLAEFAQAGVDIVALASQLQIEGAQSFSKSWDDLMAVIASKTRSVAGGTQSK
jgi:transaldolase